MPEGLRVNLIFAGLLFQSRMHSDLTSALIILPIMFGWHNIYYYIASGFCGDSVFFCLVCLDQWFLCPTLSCLCFNNSKLLSSGQFVKRYEHEENLRIQWWQNINKMKINNKCLKHISFSYKYSWAMFLWKDKFIQWYLIMCI